MLRARSLVFLAWLGLFCAPAPGQAGLRSMVLRGGQIWTAAPERPTATAIVLEGERIAFVGDDEAASEWIRAGTRVVELEGRRVLPGLIDAHVHVLWGGDELLAPDLRSAKSEREFAQRLAAAAAEVPAGTWLTGGLWDHENWPGGALPTRAVLDEFTPDHPVFVSRLDGHMGVANSRAIEIAKVTAETPAPTGGEIVKDPETGEPAGVFKDTAMVLISRHVPRWDDAARLRRARAALRHAAELGVTGLHDMLPGYPPIETYQQLRSAGELTCRITFFSPLASVDRWGAVRIGRGFGDDWLQLGGCKAFADGSLGSTTAWFFEPYADAPETRGLPMPAMLDGSMRDNLATCGRLGLQPAIHAIGDRAIRELLDHFAATENLERPRIEHAQHIDPKDFARFASQQVIASVQPYHAADDGRWAEKRIGAERSASTYAFRSLLDAGVMVAFGSDWPVAPLSPWLAMEAAVTRQTLDGAHPDGWVPAQKVSIEEALLAYTRGSAYASFDEADRGVLRPGALADLIVLDRDVLTIDATEISEVNVNLTVVGGRVVWER